MPIEKLSLAEFYRKFVSRDPRIEAYRVEIAGVGRRSGGTSDEIGPIPHNVMWRPDLVQEQTGRAGYMVRWLMENSSPARSPHTWEQSWLDVADQDILEGIRDSAHCLKLLAYCCQLIVEQELLQRLISGEMKARGVKEPVGHVPNLTRIAPLIWSRSEHTIDFANSTILVGGSSVMDRRYIFAPPGAQMKFSNIIVSTNRESEKAGRKPSEKMIRQAYEDCDGRGEFDECQSITEHFPYIRAEVNSQLGRDPDDARGLTNETIRRHITELVLEPRKRSTNQSTNQSTK